MNKFLNKGRVIVSCVSVLSILAVSLLSMFTGVTFIASADDAVISSPSNGTYDADVVILEGGISYTAVDPSVKTEVSSFTAYDTAFLQTAEGKGTAKEPYIIKTANQFAAVATGNLVDANGKLMSTEGLTFKVADNVKAFNMSNTTSGADFSGDMTAEQVKAALTADGVAVKDGLQWKKTAIFKGRFDGNGVVVYGLKADPPGDADCAGIFPEVNGSVTIRNLTVKNCYFIGDAAAVLIAKNSTSYSTVTTVQNCAIYNNVVVCRRRDEGIMQAGILTGACGADSTITVTDCLVYGNEAKHQGYHKDHSNTYDITYGLYGRFHGLTSATVSNSIIMDCAPHTLYYGSNAFHKSTYTNVYTNGIGQKWTNVDYVSSGAKKITYTYEYVADATGAVNAFFDRATNDAASDGINYKRTMAAGSMFSVTADDIKAATALDGIDSAKWTYNENGYPIPKVYSVREYGVGDAWSGEVALFYSGGDGSATSPYEIATAEELALMMLSAKEGQHFVLKADIILNDTTAEDWTKTAKQWFTSNDVNAFGGTLNGNGYTVSGLYYTGEQAGEYAGLIPVIASGANIKNIKIAASELNGDNALGAVAGAVADNAAKVIKISNVTVEDTVKYSNSASATGIIGTVGYSAINMSDCIAKSGGLFGGVTGQASVKRCVSVGAYPFGSTQYVKAEGVYTNTAGAELEGVTVLTDEEMIGNAARTNMTGLNIPTSWKIVPDSYPAPTGNEASANGVKGEVWSGAVASDYAGGSGTEDDPYLIETAEQMARFAYSPDNGTEESNKYYKLTADIYLNDVNGNLWQDKIGCNEWYTQRTTKSYANNKYTTLDGDGYIVHGLYINHTDGSAYVRAGLIPQMGVGSVVKNLGVSEAYLIGTTDNADEPDSLGAIVGTMSTWNSAAGVPALDPHDAEANRIIIAGEKYQRNEPKLINCFADHTCVISGYQTGGLVGATGASIYFENCIFTGSLYGQDNDYYRGSFVGQDWSYGTTVKDSLSLPQTCGPIMGGSSLASWRSSQAQWVISAIDSYYFSSAVCNSAAFIKINKPAQRVGDAAKEVMTGLDWVDEYDPNAEDQTTWLVVEGGTPIPSIFAKNHTKDEYEKYSDKAFNAPSVTVSFITGTSEVVVDDISGPMYSKISLPEIERPGYEFTGWYVFDDCSIEYPNDYFPPRDLILYAGWDAKGVIQNFENYPDTIWDYDDTFWTLNRPGVKGGYKNAYVRNGSKSMHLLDTNTEAADVLLNYEDMLVPGKAYTMTFWVATDKESNPATLVSLVHNNYPDYLDTATAVEDMAVVAGLKVGEWTQYSYSFTAKTQWVSLRATGGASLYFDDIIMASIDGTLSDGKVINLGTGAAGDGSLSPNTDNSLSVAVAISAIMACAVIVVISRKNLVEIIED